VVTERDNPTELLTAFDSSEKLWGMKRVAVLAALVVAVAACGSDSDEPAETVVVTLAEDAATEDPTAEAVDPPDTADTTGDTAPPVEEASEEAGEGFEMLPLPEGATAKFSQPMLFDPQDGQCKAWLAEARPLSPGVEYPEGTVGTTTTSVDGKTTTTVFRCEDGEWVQVGEPVTTGNG
jgi:hypothetical protein